MRITASQGSKLLLKCVLRRRMYSSLPFMCGGNFTWDGWYNGDVEEDVAFFDGVSLDDEVVDCGALFAEVDPTPHPVTLFFLALLL